MTKKVRLTAISSHEMKETKAGGPPGTNCICNCSCQDVGDGMSIGNGVYGNGKWAGGVAEGGIGDDPT
jgi:hypothetical protein